MGFSLNLESNQLNLFHLKFFPIRIVPITLDLLEIYLENILLLTFLIIFSNLQELYTEILNQKDSFLLNTQLNGKIQVKIPYFK